jgi:hypothetical protein
MQSSRVLPADHDIFLLCVLSVVFTVVNCFKHPSHNFVLYVCNHIGKNCCISLFGVRFTQHNYYHINSFVKTLWITADMYHTFKPFFINSSWVNWILSPLQCTYKYFFFILTSCGRLLLLTMVASVVFKNWNCGDLLAQWFSAFISAAGNECAAGSAVVRTTVAARNFQAGHEAEPSMRRLMNRSSGVFTEYFGFLPSFKW